MKLGISNIAWEPSDDEQVAALLARHGVTTVDIAPGKYFADIEHCSAAEIERVRSWWESRGFRLTGMQSLLFGTTGLNLFGASDVQSAMLRRLDAVCRIGAGLGATRLVFGSPKNRNASGLPAERAHAAAVDFFRRLGDVAAGHSVTVCLEANPAIYGCNFMLSTADAAFVVRSVMHPAIRLQLDLGTIAVNGESLPDVLREHADLIGHVHLSEPNLATLGANGSLHAAYAPLLNQTLPGELATIEMLAADNASRLGAIESAVGFAAAHYADTAR